MELILRSVITSAKGGIRLVDLNRDFKELQGTDIPFRQEGFSSLRAYLESVSGLRIFIKNGECYVETLADEKNAHLKKMISAQKPSRRKGRGRGGRSTAYGRIPAPYKFYSFPSPTPRPVSLPMEMNGKVNSKASNNTRPKTPEFEKHGIVLTVSERKVKDELADFAKKHGLGEPEYKVSFNSSSTSNGKKRAIFYGSVVVGDKKYSGYPTEASSLDEAEVLAATEALKKLREMKITLAVKSNETQDTDLMLTRIINIINSYSAGVFMEKMPKLYENTYHETLPYFWTDIVQQCNSIVVERGADNTKILQKYKPPRYVEKVETNTRSTYNQPEKPHEVQRPITNNSKNFVNPGFVTLPNQDYWMVYVTSIMSTTNIWVRLAFEEYRDAFEEMIGQMRNYYDNIKEETFTEIQLGHFYVVCFEDEWYRVQCTEFDPISREASVIFIDTGDEDVFNADQLKELYAPFARVPAQAFRLILDGVEDFEDCESILPLLDDFLLGNPFFVKPCCTDSGPDGPCASVVFYDTTGEEDVDVNVSIYDLAMRKVATFPTLAEVGMKEEGYISYATTNGDIYVQLKSEGLTVLSTALNNFAEECLNERTKKEYLLTENAFATKDKIYLAYVDMDDHWYRSKIVDILPNGIFVLYTLDVGKIIYVDPLTNIVDIEKYNHILATFPPQAVLVKLHGISDDAFSERFIQKIYDLAPATEPVTIEVISAEASRAPAVEIFRQMECSLGILPVPLNRALMKEFEPKSQSDGNNNIRVKKRAALYLRGRERKISEPEDLPKVLTPPTIPNEGILHVHVPLASSPTNFFVQPRELLPALDKMSMKLQESCRQYKGPALTRSSIKGGCMYAGKFCDNRWYRVYVSNFTDDNRVTAYFCDFGNTCTLPFDHLLPLEEQFFELPYCAVRAKLAGIRPVGNKWTESDCKLFCELAMEQNLSSNIVSRGSVIKNDIPGFDICLAIQIENRSNSNLSCRTLNALLIQENRARFTD